MVDIAKFLVFLTSFDILNAVRPQGRPIVIDADDYGFHALTSGVHSANSSVYLIQDVLCVIFVDALQKWPLYGSPECFIFNDNIV